MKTTWNVYVLNRGGRTMLRARNRKTGSVQEKTARISEHLSIEAQAEEWKSQLNSEELVANVIPSDIAFDVLNRNNFICRFCGARPGHDNMRAWMLWPWKQGGTFNRNNIVPSCTTCNPKHKSGFAFPRGILSRETDADGWYTWKRFGWWSIKVNIEADNENIVLESGRHGIFVGIQSCHESDWIDHMREKPWYMIAASDSSTPQYNKPIRAVALSELDTTREILSDEQNEIQCRTISEFTQGLWFLQSLITSDMEDRKRRSEM